MTRWRHSPRILNQDIWRRNVLSFFLRPPYAVKSKQEFPHMVWESSSSSSSPLVTGWALIDLFRPRLIVFSKVFQVVFVRLVHNSAFLSASCCYLFMLHVVANLICIFLISRPPLLLSAFSKVLNSFCGLRVSIPLFYRKISSQLMSIFFYPFFWGPNFASV